jgi:serine/threonine-protein kinase
MGVARYNTEAVMANSTLIDAAWVQSQFPDLADVSHLGGGGQKLVFSASHPTDGDVVLKLIRPGQTDEATEREILAVNAINAPRVPQIYGHGLLRTPFGDIVWLREHRVHGRTVREELRRVGQFAPELLLRLALHVLQALVKAEEVHIVHRDVKPDNIVLSGEEFWLLDFGIARHLKLQSLTGTDQIWGKFTLGYSPPEQCRNLKPAIDSRSDLFALGITLYECATGQNPFWFPPANQLEVLNRVEHLVLRPLDLNLRSGNDFRDLVDAMTQKRRDLRPRTAGEALTWIEEVCSREFE